MIPEDFLYKHIPEKLKKEGFSFGDITTKMIYSAMIEYAKFHVEKALKASHQNNQLPEEDLNFTLDCYSLKSIK